MSLASDRPREVAAIGNGSVGLCRRDFFLLATFCLVLFGYELFSGRPLSLHEARLPETAREMLASHNWLFWIFPQSGGRPWLERPPVPHWILIGTSLLLGQRCDSVWVVRLPSLLMGTLVVLLTAWMAAAWFGRNVGLLSGFVLATMYEFYAYSVLAEDDIFLAATVALAVAAFVRLEFMSPSPGTPGEGRGGGSLTPKAEDPLPNPPPEYQGRGKSLVLGQFGFLGNRPWEVWAFYFLLGLTNMVKSPLVGAVVVAAPVAGFVVWARDPLRARRYAWFWGWVIFAILLLAWPLAAAHSYPDVWRNWKFDYGQTHEFDEPIWYYPVALAGLCLPWIWASVFGFIGTRKEAMRQGASGTKFLWCWAILSIVALSIPHRKHHHYAVPSLAPWAILSAIGVRDIYRGLINLKATPPNPMLLPFAFAIVETAAVFIFRHTITVPMPAVIGLMLVLFECVVVFAWGMYRREGANVAGACVLGIACAYCWGQTWVPDLVAQDTLFLKRVEGEAPANQPLYVNSDLGGDMDFFRIQFYLRPTAILLHNLTYLRDQAITASDVWVVTRYHDLPFLQTLGQVVEVDQSARSRREKSPAQRFTLFHLHFFPDLKRYPRPSYINTLQAMDRQKGPYCGPPLPARKIVHDSPLE
jgi:4-amino-4-deoxy-L-arabinose transferase-like glycosyltransferase